MLFPLPLTPFEHYYWCDDRPEYPTTFPLELSFAGVPRRGPLTEALGAALRRHPLLTTWVDPCHRPQPAWIAGPDQPPSIDWAGDSEPTACKAGERIDLAQSSGLRIWVREAERSSRVLLQFHHATCDALGALQFTEDWLTLYHCRIAGISSAELLPNLDSQRLKWRGDFGLTETQYRPNLADAWRTVRLWGRLLVRQPAVLPAPCAAHPTREAASSFPGLVTHSLDTRTWRGLRTAAASSGATVNDVLLRDLFLVLDAWNVRHVGSRRRPLRITMPTAIRHKGDKLMPAANLLGFAFLTRRARECRDPIRLLGSIRDETAAIKRWRLGLYFLGGLGVASRHPALLRWQLHRNRSMATAVFSNVGRVFARSPLRGRDGKLCCGDLTLLQVRGAPPVRPGTRASFALVRYAHEILVNLRCDPHWFSPEDAQALIEAYAEQLRQTGTKDA